MTLLSGKRLTVVGVALIVLSAAAAARVGVSGVVVGTAAPASAPGKAGAAGPGEALSAGDHVALAFSAEKRGALAEALSHYRAAVSADPRCVDRRSPGFLGEAFEEKLKYWIAAMKSGRIAAGPAALSDASFIFRRMYGGCG